MSRALTRHAVLAIALMAALAGCDRLLGADRRIERAAELYAEGQYLAAMDDVKTALEAEPGHVDGRVLLARISLRVGDPEAARRELDRAIEAGADPAVLRDLHYDIFIAQGRYRDALIAAAADEDLAPLRRLLVMGLAQTALGETGPAEQSITQALELEPDNRDLQLLQARWLWASGRLDDAEHALEQILAQYPEFGEAWMYQGRFALGGGDARRAEASFRQASENGTQLSLPDQAAVRAGIVESLLALGELDAAQAALRELNGLTGDAFITHYLRGRLAYAREDFPAASAELQRAVRRQPANSQARLLLGAALLHQGAVEQAESELAHVVAEQPDNVEARKLLAQIYLSRDDAAGAQRLLADTPTVAVQDAGVDWLSGSALLLGGQTAEAIAKFEQAATAEPENVLLRLDLARAYLMAGRRDDAAGVLAALPAGEGGAVRRQLTVLAEIIGRDPAAARQGLARLVRENPKDALLLTAAGTQQLGVDDRAAALATLRRAVEADPQLVDARLGLAEALFQAGDKGGGEEQLRKALELDPKSERASIGLARVALWRGERAAARQVLERAIGEEPAAVESRLLLAELALHDKDPARMNSLLEQVLSVAKNRPYALNRAGQVLLQASQYDAAFARFSEAASEGMEEADVNAAVALIALGRAEEARGRLESAARRRPAWPAPVAYLVVLDAGQQRYEQALARIGTLERAGGTAWAAQELRGGVQAAAGQHAAAVAAFEKAFQERPTSSLAVKLFRVRTAAGMHAPEASLESWLDRQPRDPLPRVLLAEHHHRKGDRKAAIAQYERTLEFATSPSVLNNLAWLYHESGDGRAAELARRAYDAAPENAEIADTYGWILVESKQVKAGLPILEKSARAAPDNGEIQYHYAAALARSGKRQDAAGVLRPLLQSPAAFPSRGDAEKLLRSLTSG